MPQGSTTTQLNIASGYFNTQFSLGGIAGAVAAGNSAAGQQTSMSGMRYTQSGTQQGSKLIGTGGVGNPSQGHSVALSADGNTLAIGGYSDNSNNGAVWVFTRSGTTWTQQGSKLVGSGNVGAAQQGFSVALSADGNTLAVGSIADNSNIGAAWVFTRSGTTWTQQGSKLVGTGYTLGSYGAVYQGSSIALSADGNTLAFGALIDNNAIGAAWVFTRSGTTWTQQGSKLVGTGYDYSGFDVSQGIGIGLSADGNILAVGAYADANYTGAVWVYTRSGTTWTQQGSKLVGTGGVGGFSLGWALDISAEGNTIAAGGLNDNSGVGATWIFTRTGTTWTQQGSKLVGSGNVGAAQQGSSVALSADGNVLAIGGPGDNSNAGATWIFTRTGTTWTQQGSKLIGTGATGKAYQGRGVALAKTGNTLAVGGEQDDTNAGATWVFV